MGDIFPNLNSLDLIYCTELDDCNFEKLINLKKLTLDKSYIRKLKFMKKLKQLKSVSINECEYLESGRSKIPNHIKFLTWTGIDTAKIIK